MTKPSETTPDQYASGEGWSVARYGTSIFTTMTVNGNEVTDEGEYATEDEAARDFPDVVDTIAG